MNTHNICFCGEIRNILVLFSWKKVHYLEQWEIYDNNLAQTAQMCLLMWTMSVWHQGPVVRSAVSLTSSLRAISLTILEGSIYNFLKFFAEKMWVAFALLHCKSYSHFFSKKFQHICVSLDVNFNESLTNDVVSFEQLGPEFQIIGRAVWLSQGFCDWDIVNASIYLSVRPSHYVLLNHWAEFIKTSYMTSPRSKGVREQVCLYVTLLATLAPSMGTFNGMPSTAQSSIFLISPR